MVKVTKIIEPGAPGFKDKASYPWSGLQHILSQMNGCRDKSVNLEIHGFFLVDTRRHPPLIIFKDCAFPMQVGLIPPLDDMPKPFQHVGEAVARIRSMHLSWADCQRIQVHALCPDPGLGAAKPDVIVMTKDELKHR
jgi:hypothetical protein